MKMTFLFAVTVMLTGIVAGEDYQTVEGSSTQDETILTGARGMYVDKSDDGYECYKRDGRTICQDSDDNICYHGIERWHCEFDDDYLYDCEKTGHGWRCFNDSSSKRVITRDDYCRSDGCTRYAGYKDSTDYGNYGNDNLFRSRDDYGYYTYKEDGRDTRKSSTDKHFRRDYKADYDYIDRWYCSKEYGRWYCGGLEDDDDFSGSRVLSKMIKP